MFIAPWDVSDLQDNKKKIPEREATLIALVLKQNSISIAALSENRLPERGQLKEVEGSYTLF